LTVVYHTSMVNERQLFACVVHPHLPTSHNTFGHYTSLSNSWQLFACVMNAHFGLCCLHVVYKEADTKSWSWFCQCKFIIYIDAFAVGYISSYGLKLHTLPLKKSIK
jgi:hypothetical protein